MAREEFNIKEKTKDEKLRRNAVYLICGLILLLTILLDIYLIPEIL